MGSLQQAMLMHSAGGGDQYFGSVVNLTHFDGTNGDTGPYPNVVSGSNQFANLEANSLSTSIFKFGTASLRCPSLGRSNTGAPSNTDYSYGTGDFTIEFWLYLATLATKNVCGQGNGSDANPVFYTYSDGRIVYYTSNVEQIVGVAGTVATTTWYHIAASRVSGSTRLFVAGTQVGSTYTDSSNIINAQGFTVGANGNGSVPFDGYIDEFRVTKGVGRYTSNFTPPIAAFPDS